MTHNDTIPHLTKVPHLKKIYIYFFFFGRLAVQAYYKLFWRIDINNGYESGHASSRIIVTTAEAKEVEVGVEGGGGPAVCLI